MNTKIDAITISIFSALCNIHNAVNGGVLRFTKQIALYPCFKTSNQPLRRPELVLIRFPYFFALCNIQNAAIRGFVRFTKQIDLYPCFETSNQPQRRPELMLLRFTYFLPFLLHILQLLGDLKGLQSKQSCFLVLNLLISPKEEQN